MAAPINSELEAYPEKRTETGKHLSVGRRQKIPRVGLLALFFFLARTNPLLDCGLARPAQAFTVCRFLCVNFHGRKERSVRSVKQLRRRPSSPSPVRWMVRSFVRSFVRQLIKNHPSSPPT